MTTLILSANSDVDAGSRTTDWEAARMGQVRLNYAISKETEKNLSSYCELTGRTASDVVRQLICEVIDGDIKLPPPSVVAERDRLGPRRERRTDMWLAPKIFDWFGKMLDEKKYPAKSAVISCMLDDFLRGRTEELASEPIRITALIDRETYAKLVVISKTRQITPDAFLAEIARDYIERVKEMETA